MSNEEEEEYDFEDQSEDSLMDQGDENEGEQVSQSSPTLKEKQTEENQEPVSQEPTSLIVDMSQYSEDYTNYLNKKGKTGQLVNSRGGTVEQGKKLLSLALLDDDKSTTRSTGTFRSIFMDSGKTTVNGSRSDKHFKIYPGILAILSSPGDPKIAPKTIKLACINDKMSRLQTFVGIGKIGDKLAEIDDQLVEIHFPSGYFDQCGRSFSAELLRLNSSILLDVLVEEIVYQSSLVTGLRVVVVHIQEIPNSKCVQTIICKESFPWSVPSVVNQENYAESFRGIVCNSIVTVLNIKNPAVIEAIRTISTSGNDTEVELRKVAFIKKIKMPSSSVVLEFQRFVANLSSHFALFYMDATLDVLRDFGHLSSRKDSASMNPHFSS